jgi:hypothetical protein
MPRMIEVIRQSALPSNVMQFAAKGALLVPPQEMIEILVYLAVHNKVFGEQARMTLAGWDEKSAREAAANSATPTEVLNYFIDPENLRPALLPALVENSAVSESSLAALAKRATREQVEVLLRGARVSHSPAILSVLVSNPNLRGNEVKKVQEEISSKGAEPATGSAEPVPPAPPEQPQAAASSAVALNQDSSDELTDEAINAFLAEHADEIGAENEKPFQPIGGSYEEAAVEQAKTAAAGAGTPNTASADALAKPAPQKKWILSPDEQRGSALQKISKLDIKGRIQLAMKGNKEERSLLIRDGTKIVALAVLESPKLTDGEVEKFASQKNVLEAVLRAIPMKRRFMKMYPVVRSLTFNPRTPIDVALGVIKNLLIQDLRHLSGNKEVSDTVRKLAMKMFRQKLDITKR